MKKTIEQIHQDYRFQDQGKSTLDLIEYLFKVGSFSFDSNIKDPKGKRTGAYGDGASRPLSNFYATLAEAQKDYPVATALTQEIDGVAIEQAIANQEPTFFPAGTYLINHKITQSNKIVRFLGVTGEGQKTVFKCNASTYIESELMRLDGCDIIWEKIWTDGDYKCHGGLRSDNGFFRGKDIFFEKHGRAQHTLVNVVALAFDDPKSVSIDGFGCQLLQSRFVTTGAVGGEDGLARAIQIGNATVGTSKGDIRISGFWMDCTGSEAPQLDCINVVGDSLRHIYIERPLILYNENTRRCIKIQGGFCDVIAPYIDQCATFTPDGAGNTDTGKLCFTCIDYTDPFGIGGGITVIGGYVNAKGFGAAIARSSNGSGIGGNVRAMGTKFVGSIYKSLKLISIDSAPKLAAAVANIAANVLTYTAHGLATAQAVSVAAEAGGTLPTGLAASTLYYVRAATADTITFHPTLLDASNNTNILAISGGTGTFTIYRGKDDESFGIFTDNTPGQGSGCENCTFVNFTMPFNLRQNFSYMKNCMFYDPINYAGYIGSSNNSIGHVFTDNEVITVTSGALNNSRIVRIWDVDGYKVANNRLTQFGNTGHATIFIGSTDADSSGMQYGNIAPVGTSAFTHTTGTVLGDVTIAKKAAATTALSNVGTGEDNLQTIAIPPSPFYNNGDWITIECRGRFANNANAKTLKFYWGATLVCTISLPTSVAGNWAISVTVAKTGASTQDIEFVAHSTNAAGTGTNTVMGRVTSTESETASVTVKCTGEGTSNADITQEMMWYY